MSHTLGPIHYLMYDKIQFQDRITEYLLGDNPAFHRLNEVMPPVSREDLATLIDTPNIHGWLSARIDVVESRLSYALHATENAEEKLYAFGKKMGKGYSYDSPDDVFEAIHGILLDGMPCDGALEAQGDEEGNLYLIEVEDVHAPYEKNPLATDPSLSLTKTCHGGHDHDHHEAFDVQREANLRVKEEGDATPKSVFYTCRLALLRGFMEPAGYGVEMISGTDYKVYKK
ncbi:MAG: hypothetical protein Q4Q17_00710 [Tissierellia bacterium]|nr:hypothetical protein [Tissierellia bacterium]